MREWRHGHGVTPIEPPLTLLRVPASASGSTSVAVPVAAAAVVGEGYEVGGRVPRSSRRSGSGSSEPLKLTREQFLGPAEPR
jgi:hypothetical protein